MEEKELLDLIARDPSKGLDIAIETYGGMVKAAVVQVLGNNHPSAEECVADVFIKLWRGCAKLAPSSFRSYLYTVARNTAIDLLRKEGRYRPAELEEARHAAGPNLEDMAMDKINQAIVATCVNELPEPDRSIFLRRYYHGERVKEIAENLGLKPKKVENTLCRGKRQLEQKLMNMGVLI